MPETVFVWSPTASSNANADSGIGWAEGMLPGGVNNSARAMMAALAKMRDDQGGKLVTTGSSNAYVLTTASGVPALADGVKLAFIASFSNTGSATLNVDTLGAKAIRKGADAALVSGDIVQNAAYVVVYDASANSAAGAWLLLNPALPTPGLTPETFVLSGDITPAQIIANQNDYAPTGFSTATVLRLSSDATRTITGLAGGADGRIIIFQNIGSFRISLTFEDAASLAANRFTFDAEINDGWSLILRYDGVSSRWRSVALYASPARVGDYIANTPNRFLSTHHVWSDAAPVAVAFATTMTIDLDTGIHFEIDATDNFTLNFPSNPKPGQTGTIRIFHNGAGRTMTLPTSVGWHTPDATQIALSTSTGAADILSYIVRATSIVHIFRSVLGSRSL